MDQEVRFLGSVVKNRLDRGWPFHVLAVSRDAVTLTRPLGRSVRVARADVYRVEATWTFPMFSRVVAFHHAQGTLMFVPYRRKRLLATLRALGWPVPPRARAA